MRRNSLALLAAVIVLVAHGSGASGSRRRAVGPSPLNREGRIAYADRLDGAPGPDVTGSQIFTVNAEGADRRQLTSSLFGNFFPAWSPNGTTLAIVSVRSGAPQIWTMAADGSSPTQLTFASFNILPAWSPDAARLAFVSNGTGQTQIWTMNADGTNPVQLTSQGNNNVPAWSPDGRRIAFWSGNANGFGQVWVMDAVDGSNKTQLTNPRFDSYTPNGSSANAPAWLFNDKIVYWSGIEQQYGQIWVMNGDGSNPQQLTHEPAPASSDNPTWSADGKRILFATSRTGRPEIWMMDADGTNQHPLIRDIRLIPGRTSWQPVPAR
jgi:Tol biopolymer transport system component